MKLRKGKTRKQAQEQVRNITGKKAAKGRAAAEKKGVEMSTAIRDKFVEIRAEKGIDAAIAFLRSKGVKGKIF